MTSARASALVARLRDAAEEVVTVVERVDGELWRAVPAPGVWSIGKEAEHVADAAAYHQWIVRFTIGERVSSRRPAIERSAMTTDHSTAEVAGLIRQRTDESAALIGGLTDEQLDLPTRPPRARGQLLETTIELVLIGHYHVHRAGILAKLEA